MNKAPDAYRTISEVAEYLDLPQHVLRFWETRFSQIKPLKRAGGRRFYRPDDVDLLKGIRYLLYSEGYTIKGVQRILKDQGIRAVLALVREDGEGFSPPSLKSQAPLPVDNFAFKPDPILEAGSHLLSQSNSAFGMSQDEIDEPDPVEGVPPPLPVHPHMSASKPSQAPQWRSPAELEAEFAAFFDEEARNQPIPNRVPSPESVESTRAILPHHALSQVSMFRGGLAQAEKPAQAEKLGEEKTAPHHPITSALPSSAAEVLPLFSPPSPASQNPTEREEARAVLGLALQELAACRVLIEDLRNTV